MAALVALGSLGSARVSRAPTGTAIGTIIVILLLITAGVLTVTSQSRSRHPTSHVQGRVVGTGGRHCDATGPKPALSDKRVASRETINSLVLAGGAIRRIGSHRDERERS
jgi:hypothetical protein